MKNIATYLQDKEPVKQPKKVGGINSPRSEQVGILLAFMGETKTLPEERTLESATPGAGKKAKAVRIRKRFRYWLGRTRYVTPDKIRMLMLECKNAKNPPALFNFLLKQCKRSSSKANLPTSTPTLKN